MNWKGHNGYEIKWSEKNDFEKSPDVCSDIRDSY